MRVVRVEPECMAPFWKLVKDDKGNDNIFNVADLPSAPADEKKSGDPAQAALGAVTKGLD